MAEGRYSYRLAGRRVWVAGHKGMVGSAIVRRLARVGCDVLTADRQTVDLRDPAEVRAWMESARPDTVFLAAAKVGGILANDTRPAEFLFDNLAIQNSVIHAAHQTGVQKLMFLGSTCIYPRLAPQPMNEDALLTGPLEPTNEWYAIAKIAGLKMCQAYRKQYGADFISAMPTNLYGPGDNYSPAGSHVLPALIAKIHKAKLDAAPTVTVWGSGKPRREFLHVDDLADALVFMMEHYSGEVALNVGVGDDISIGELSQLIADVVGWRGQFVHDLSKPDGTPRKLVDVGRLNALGWAAGIGLREGIEITYRDYLAALEDGSLRVG